VQISEHLEKTMSFNVHLSKLLTEDAQCVPSWKIGIYHPPAHHLATLRFQFGL